MKIYKEEIKIFSNSCIGKTVLTAYGNYKNKNK